MRAASRRLCSSASGTGTGSSGTVVRLLGGTDSALMERDETHGARPMEKDTRKLEGRTAIVTGAAKRLGAAIARALHAEGMNLLLHYNKSEKEAAALCKELNKERRDSATIAQADLANTQGLESLVKAALQWDGLDVLVNNASAFRPTPIGSVLEDDWDELMASNL